MTLILALLLTLHTMPADQASPLCATEDQETNCVWIAPLQGNGQGSSFMVHDGEVIYLP